ncbi:MAG TPA: ABC transporter permease [Vicinamibacteria bacterium]|nr:ABC transporter permease [Vicinamibacteria bacterium]
MGMGLRELRHVVRKLLRTPGFTSVSILTLALGIGANAAIFSVVNGVLLKPLPFREPERLVGIWHKGFGFEGGVTQSPATYFTYREENQVFEDVGMWDNDFVTVTGLEEPERVDAILVTDGTLPILGVEPSLGRSFTPEDDAPGSPETVILSNGYWRSRFGGSADVLGSTLTVNGRPMTIIGVMPEGFRFLRFDPALWLPFQFNRTELWVGDFSYQAVGRLRPGATIDAANSEVERMIPLAVEKFPRGMTLENLRDVGLGADVHLLEQDAVGDVGNVLWVLFGTVGLVLVIACANVANLFLVRADGRQQEMALRTALGADKRRLASELLLESVVLGLLGGAAGLALATAGVRFLVALGPSSLPRLQEISIDLTVLAFTGTISLVAGVLFGSMPVLKYGALNLITALKEGGRASSDGRDRQRARGALVVAQVALALVLLVGSGLMIRSFQALCVVEPGFVRPDEVLSFKISIPESEVQDPEQTARTHEQLLRRIEQIPGVSSVGLSSSITMDGWDSNDGIYVEGFPIAEGAVPPMRRFKWITENYFETMGNPVVAGRPITWTDIYSMAEVAVVTENFAREYWDSPAGAIGKRIRNDLDAAWREIVGVVGDIHDDGVAAKATPTIFWPMLQRDFWGQEILTRRTMGYAVRSARVGTRAFLDEIRHAVWSLNGNLPIANVATLSELLDRSMARTSFTLVMLGIASSVALLLGVIGIYGVISYAVSRRTREIGVRMALGARRADVSRLVLRDGAKLTILGVSLGIVAALALTRLMSSLLFGVDTWDVTTYVAVASFLAGVSLFSSYLPARRAASVHPLEALRWE